MKLNFLYTCLFLWSLNNSQCMVFGKSEDNKIKNGTQKVSDSEMLREKRQLYDIPMNYPVYYDGGVQPTVTVLTPSTGSSVNVVAQQQQNQPQQPGFLPNLGLNQNLPILGTLVGQLPGQLNSNGQNNGGLLAGLPGGLGNGLNGLLGGLGSLGGLGGLGGLGALGGLGNLGTLGNLGNLGNPGSSTNAVASCPLTQKLTCRCESLIPIKPLVRKIQQLGNELNTEDGIQIVKQEAHQNKDGTHETRLIFNNGLHIYKRSGKEKITTQQGQTQITEVSQGFFALKYTNNLYFTIYYTIDNIDYTVRADITSGPPITDFDNGKK